MIFNSKEVAETMSEPQNVAETRHILISRFNYWIIYIEKYAWGSDGVATPPLRPRGYPRVVQNTTDYPFDCF